MYKCILTFLSHSLIDIANDYRGMDNIDRSFRYMGFMNSDDYKNVYPGKFVGETKNNQHTYISTHHIDRRNKKDPSWFECEYISFLDPRRTDSINACITMSYMRGDIPLTTITINELRKIKIFKKYPYKDCWFCSDWKEDDIK